MGNAAGNAGTLPSLQQLSTSDLAGGRLGSLGPWTPAGAGGFGEASNSANLQSLLSLNNLLHLGSIGSIGSIGMLPLGDFDRLGLPPNPSSNGSLDLTGVVPGDALLPGGLRDTRCATVFLDVKIPAEDHQTMYVPA